MGAALTGTIVVLVDDDADSMAFLECLLELEGAIVRTAPSAADALVLLGSVKPDVFLLDVEMPGMDGYELLSTIRKDPVLLGIPAIAVTADAFERDKQRAAAAGFVGHVSKPVEWELLLAAIVDALAANDGDPASGTRPTPPRRTPER